MIWLEAGIVTPHAEALVAFYVSALGFTVERVLEFPQGTVHRLRRDEACCKIYEPSSGAQDAPVAEPWHRFRGFAYAALHVDDAAGELARAEAAGARVMMPVTSHRPGACAAMIADPEGNIWELLQES
jgi:predicted enzyme related to lactoylglutathione lyase